MKKIVASVSLAALGASALHTASAQDASASSLQLTRPSKPWSISGTLRGFYDDNPSTAPSSAFNNADPNQRARDSFGFEVSPSASYSLTTEQTTAKLTYLYTLKYYENKPAGNADHYDQSHNFTLDLNHAFSAEYLGKVSDSFVIGQEPDLLRSGNTIATPYRIPGNNIRNFGAIELDGNLSREFGFDVGYNNTYYAYADDSPDIAGPGAAVPGELLRASNTGLLNRLEHNIFVDGKYIVTPETTGVLGFRFMDTDYTGDQLIGGNEFVPASQVHSSDRNNRTYSPYVGLDHTFLPELTGSVRMGVTYADYYNSSSTGGDWSPYALVSMRYVYAQDSYVQLGFSHDRNSTDASGVQTINGVSSFTVDSESSTLFGSINHHFAGTHIYGYLTGQYQHSTYKGGGLDDTSYDYYLLGLNLQYRFTQNLSAEVGYNYDKLMQADQVPGYDRNRVYIGVTASY